MITTKKKLSSAIRECIRLDQPIKAVCWKSLWFDVYGKSYLDSIPFSTEAEASTDIQKTIISRPDLGDRGLISAEDGSWVFPFKDYSFAIPIPFTR